MTNTELEDRLIQFSIAAIEIAGSISKTGVGKHLANQLIRSGTSLTLNYGEARGGESKKDFLHKIKIVLKELRESFVCLKIIDRAKFYKSNQQVTNALKENNELIAIFVASIKTSNKNH